MPRHILIYTNSDYGIDGEIEFEDDQGRAAGKRLYVQLKSGDSYLKQRERDGAEVFRIKNPRWGACARPPQFMRTGSSPLPAWQSARRMAKSAGWT